MHVLVNLLVCKLKLVKACNFSTVGGIFPTITVFYNGIVIVSE